MSLIQEALRRQQEDMDEGAGVSPQSQPNTPPPSPQESPRIARKVQISSQAVNDESEPPPIQLPTQLESGETPPAAGDDGDAVADAGVTNTSSASEAAKPGLKIVLLIIGVVLCLAFGVWAIIFAIQTWNKSEPAAVTVNSENTNPAETTQPVVDGTAPQAAVVDVPEVIEPGTAPDPVIDSPTTPDAVPAPVVAETVVWPLLTINGLVGKGAQGAAMINSQIVGVNEAIEGVKVVDIQKQGVTLEFEGEKKFVQVGGTTE